MEGASLTRGLLSGLVERPEEAPLMDRDLGTQVQSRAQLRQATGAQLLFPQEAWVPRTALLSPPHLSSSGETLQPPWDPRRSPMVQPLEPSASVRRAQVGKGMRKVAESWKLNPACARPLSTLQLPETT